MKRLPEPAPPSPIRTLKGESIRSLRGFLQASLSSSSNLAEETKDHDNSKQHQQEQNDESEDRQPPLEKEAEEEEKETTAAATTAEKQLLAANQHGDQVRTRLLQNLGIHKPPDPTIMGTAGGTGAGTGTVTPPPSGNMNEPWGTSYEETLNDAHAKYNNMTKVNEGEDDATPSSNDNNTEESANSTTTFPTTTKTDEVHNNNNNIPSKQRRRIHFFPMVQVHPIPSFKVYSKRIQRTIWTNAEELSENVARNSLEFSYEHWDPDRVLDETSGLMIYNASQKEWIHPVHYYEGEAWPPTAEEIATPLSSEELWKMTCERLGIQPAEYYRLPTPPPTNPKTKK